MTTNRAGEPPQFSAIQPVSFLQIDKRSEALKFEAVPLPFQDSAPSPLGVLPLPFFEKCLL